MTVNIGGGYFTGRFEGQTFYIESRDNPQANFRPRSSGPNSRGLQCEGKSVQTYDFKVRSCDSISRSLFYERQSTDIHADRI